MAEAVTQKIGEEIVAGVVAQIKQHFRYLSQYHDNIGNLSSKVRILEGKIEDVQDKIEAARRNLQDIKDGVNDWLTRGKDIKEGAEKILEDKDKVGNGCWKGWCLNLKLRYRLSRKAVKEATPKIDALLEEGAQFDIVALDRRPSAVVPRAIRDDGDKKKKKTNDEIVEIQEYEKSDKAVGASAIASSSSSSGAGGGLESRESTLREVMEAIKDDQIRMVRICGMGGVGKTTMVNQVEKLARNQRLFDEIPKVEFTDKPNYGLIQSNLAKSLGFLDLEKVADELSARARELHKRLNDENKKILLIADNVWKREDLEEVGILRENEKSRCKIVLTSRKDDVCELLMKEKVFKIRVLPEPEAMNLFYHSLGNSIFFEQIAKDIVKACGGLPLAIKTIARAVANKDEDEWKVALMRLQDPTTSGGEYEAVFKTLKVSYDFLKNEKIKKLFRLCCLFPKGALPIEHLARYGMALRLFIRTGKLYEERKQAQVDIKKLVRSNLLVESDSIDCVKMHDLVWDFALSLSSEGAFMVKFGNGVEELQTRDSYTSISLKFDNQTELPEGLNFRNLEILQLITKWHSSLKFPENFFEGMGGLLVLFLEGIDAPLSAKSLQHLTKLQTLCLEKCVLKSDVSMIGNFGKLEVLSLADSEIKQLPTEIGKLRALRLLDLTNCSSLMSIAPGILSRLTCLEELYTRSIDWDEKEFEATFTEISSLPKLLVIVIQIPYKFQPPVDSLFKKVEKFMIYFGGLWRRENEYRFHNTLSCDDGSYVVLDGIIKLLLGKTESMDLWRARGLKVLVDDAETGQSSNMKTLLVSSCRELVYLVSARCLRQCNAFPLLDSLSLYYLDNLEEIYHVQNSKESFTELAPEEEKEYVGKIEFASLKHLSLHRLNNLVGFCKAAYQVELPQLEELELDNLPKLTSLCSEAETLVLEEDHNSASCPLFNQKSTQVRGFQNLRSVMVHKCDSLRQLFTHSVAISFRELHRLELNSCKSLEAIVVAAGRKEEDEEGGSVMDETFFPTLTLLLLKNLPKLSPIMPKGCTFRWPSLKKIKVENCGERSDIFANMNIKHKGTTVQEMALTSLEELDIKGTNFTELWRNHFSGGCSYKLRDMVLRGCRGCNTLSVLFSSDMVRGFHQLEKLDVREFDSLEVVFHLEEELNVGGGDHRRLILNQLEDMELSDLPRMTHVWKKVPQSLNGFYSLATLHVNGCDSLKYLFPPLIAKCLVKLRKVYIYNCKVMEEVISLRDEVEGFTDSSDKIFFPQLEELSLVDLPCLLSLGPEPCALGAPDDASSEIRHANTNSLISSHIINQKSSYPTSPALVGIGSYQFPDWSLHNLTHIELFECPKLLCVFPPNIVVRLPVLESLIIRDCPSLRYIFCSSTGRSLKKLIWLEIDECEMLEVIVKEEDEDAAAAEDKMKKLVFPKLQSMKLQMLPNLMGISSRMLAFEWPSLKILEINFCWKMMIFTSGCSTTPFLYHVCIDSCTYNLNGDLNTTLTKVQQKDLDNVTFKKKGILTINGFLVAGEHLVAEFPGWSWESVKTNPYSRLPKKRRFLITKNVPCLRRPGATSSKVTVEDKNEADECSSSGGSDKKNIPEPRTYDVSITYDVGTKTPRLWLRGYDESKTILPLELVLEDIAELHPRASVTVEYHPHLRDGKHVSLYPRLLPSLSNDISHHSTLLGFQPDVRHYLRLLLHCFAPRIPTIQIPGIEAPGKGKELMRC